MMIMGCGKYGTLIGAPQFCGDKGTSETFNSFDFSVNVFTKFSEFSDYNIIL